MPNITLGHRCRYGRSCPEPPSHICDNRPMCAKHYRFFQMKAACCKRKIANPSVSELERLLSGLEDMRCPHCDRTMNWLRRDGSTTVITLQHHRDGTVGFLCMSCNSRDGGTKNGAFLRLPLDVKQCPGCLKSLPHTSFCQNKSTRDGRAVYCRSCTAIRARNYYQKNADACRAKKRARDAERKLKLNSLKGEVLR